MAVSPTAVMLTVAGGEGGGAGAGGEEREGNLRTSSNNSVNTIRDMKSIIWKVVVLCYYTG